MLRIIVLFLFLFLLFLLKIFEQASPSARYSKCSPNLKEKKKKNYAFFIYYYCPSHYDSIRKNDTYGWRETEKSKYQKLLGLYWLRRMCSIWLKVKRIWGIFCFHFQSDDPVLTILLGCWSLPSPLLSFPVAVMCFYEFFLLIPCRSDRGETETSERHSFLGKKRNPRGMWNGSIK